MGLFDGAAGVVQGLSNGAQGLSNALTTSAMDSAKKRLGAEPRLPAPPTYMLEIWEGDAPATVYPLQGMAGKVVFRLAPSSISFTQPVRADVAMDLQGNPIVVDGGLGLARCTIRGVYGIGGAFDRTKESPGFSNMQEVRQFFLGWAALNKQRALLGLDPLRINFSIRNGSWSEWRLWSWWIIPTELPSEERSSGRPNEWSYTLSFWCLDKTIPPPADTLPAPPGPADTQSKVSALQAALGLYRDVTDSAKNLANQLANLQGSLSTLRANLIGEVTGVSDTISRATQAARGIMAAVNPATFRADVQEAYRGTVIGTVLTLGQIKTWGTTLASGSSPTPAVAPVVPPNGSIQQMAVQGGSSLAAWPSLAAQNGLRYPFVDASTNPVASYNASIPNPGTVLRVGDALPVSPATPGVGPVDLVGSDLDPAGTPGVLVGGVKNLQNALLRRIQCPRGYLPHHPDYGSRICTYLGGPLDLATVLALRDEVGTTLLADPRVVSVTSLSVDVSADVVNVSAVLSTVLGPLALAGAVSQVEAWNPGCSFPVMPS